jgi:hypothetical protein
VFKKKRPWSLLWHSLTGKRNMSAMELEKRIAQLENIEAIKKLKASY